MPKHTTPQKRSHEHHTDRIELTMFYPEQAKYKTRQKHRVDRLGFIYLVQSREFVKEDLEIVSKYVSVKEDLPLHWLIKA